MIAIGGTCKCQSACNSPHVLALDLDGIDIPAKTASGFFEHELDYGIVTAERLKAAHSEPAAFILHMDADHVAELSQCRQCVERRRTVARAQRRKSQSLV